MKKLLVALLAVVSLYMPSFSQDLGEFEIRGSHAFNASTMSSISNIGVISEDFIIGFSHSSMENDDLFGFYGGIDFDIKNITIRPAVTLGVYDKKNEPKIIPELRFMMGNEYVKPFVGFMYDNKRVGGLIGVELSTGYLF